MIEYRSFRNSDPPLLVKLWNVSHEGRGTAGMISCDAFDNVVMAQPYFDPSGLIVAHDGDRVVGFVHSSFSVKRDQSALDQESGSICMVLVHPEYRRQGIGRQLVNHARGYLRNAGVREATFGAIAPTDGFYLGLHGGSELAGILSSDAGGQAFGESMGFAPVQSINIYHRDLESGRDPVDAKLIQNRRRLELNIMGQPDQLTWWWTTRYGRVDSVEFQLRDKSTGAPVASATVAGLDFYISRWGSRAIGISNVLVPVEHRRKGFGKLLLVEIGRRLRDELVTIAEIHAMADDPAAVGLIESAGFQQVDVGCVYRLDISAGEV